MIELVAGGARSGKSSYALQRAEALTGQHVYVATATADDQGMRERIDLHKSQRGNHWGLVEEPLLLSKVLQQAQPNQVLLVDCLTLWVTNWLCSDNSAAWPAEKKRFLAALTAVKANIFLVTNEVGMGVVPMGQLSRDFVDEAGWLHQQIAAKADVVTTVTFGIAVEIKSAI